MLSDRFAHDFWYEEDGQLLQGAEGKLSEIALGTSAIQRVQGLSFDLDVKDFHPAFKEVYVDYLELMMPELGLIQTSPKGDMHGRVLFSESVSVENGKQYHRSLKDLLLADGSSAFTMSYRVPGSLNSKYDDFVVQELRPPQKLDSKHLKDLLVSADGEGLPRWYQKTFRSLFAVVKLDNQLYWKEGRKKGICPIHGTGVNPNQCDYEPEHARCFCWGDCKSPSSDSPKLITFPEILGMLVFDRDVTGRFPMADVEGETLFWQPDSEDKINELIQRLADTKQHVRFGDVLCRISDGRLVPLDGVSPASIGRGWSTSLDVKIYNAKTGEADRYNFKAPEVENILAVYLHRFPSVKVRLNRSALKDDFTWSRMGLDGDYFTQNPIRPLTGKAGDYPHLNHLLDMWHFKTKADRTNAVAMFLDRIFTGVSNFNGKHLVTIVSGNQQGVGKTELANCVLYLAQGETTTVLMENEVRKADFERQILPKIKDIPVSAILVDNVTGGAGGVFDSSNLVSMMTGQRLALRIFHSQRLFNLPNNFQWVITTNGANYSDDLIERSILVEIYHPGKPKYDQTTPLEYVIAHSEELHAEIKAMYDYWVSQGEPKFELIRRNREYFTILNSVLASNGFGGFDSNREILSQSSADPDTEIIAEIFAVWQDNPSSFKTSEIMGRLSPQTQEHACGNGADKSQQTKLGKKLAGLTGRDFQQEGKVFRFESRSVNNGYQFFFKKVPEDRAPEVAVEETKQITEKALPVAGNGANPICPEAVEESYNLGDDLNGIFD
jgi:hypothetical protein